MALLPFDEKAPCTKCGANAIEVKYEHMNQPGFMAEREWTAEEAERLRIRCLRCGYEDFRSPLA